MSTPALITKDTMGTLAEVNGGGAPLLDTTTKTARSPYAAWREEWLLKKRRGRCYQRVMSGLRLGGALRLMTLTTSVEAEAAELDIGKSFRALMMRLRRRNLCSGYVKVKEYTLAGRPHLHVVVRGGYLPQWWLSQVWSEIHLSPIVDVRAIRQRAGLAGYLAKYMGKSSDARYSWSWDWVWKGFVKDWKALLRDGFEMGASMLDIVAMWELVLDRYASRRLAPD